MDSGSRSSQESSPDRNYASDVVRVAGYHRRDFDLAVIRIDPHQHDQVRRYIAQPFGRAPRTTLGSLDYLPLEILRAVCATMDIDTLFKFRQVNQRARQVVSTVKGYKSVMVYGLEALCAILRTDIAPWFTLRDLLSVLCTRDCLLCGAFGGFVFLPSLTRCCFPCLETAPQFRLSSLADVKKRFKLSAQQLRSSVPLLRTIPGIYSMDELSRRRRLYILAEEQVAKTFRCVSGADPRPHQSSPDRNRPVLRYMASTALPYLDPSSDDVQYGVCCKCCQISLEKALKSSTIETDAAVLRDYVYSRAGLAEHFQTCAEAQRLWESSRHGTVPIEETESIRRGGYFNG